MSGMRETVARGPDLWRVPGRWGRLDINLFYPYFIRVLPAFYKEESGSGSGKLAVTGRKLIDGSEIWSESWSGVWAIRAKMGLINLKALPSTGWPMILPINLLCQSKDKSPELSKSLWIFLAPAWFTREVIC